MLRCSRCASTKKANNSKQKKKGKKDGITAAKGKYEHKKSQGTANKKMLRERSQASCASLSTPSSGGSKRLGRETSAPPHTSGEQRGSHDKA